MEAQNPAGLVGSQVCLRSIEDADIERLYRWKNDFELAALIKAYPAPLARFEIEEWFRKNQSDKNQVFFGVYLRESAEFIGVVRLRYIDRISSNTELGIYIGERSGRGRGLGKEVMQLALAYAFRDVNLHKVYLKVLASNANAIRLYESCGFVKEGILREQFWARGAYNNVVLMGILKHEF